MTASVPSEAPVERHTARERLEARLLRWSRRLLRLLPLPWVSVLGGALGWFLFTVTGFARAQALRNLEIAFGGTLPERERRSVARRCYQLYGAMVAEFLSLPRLKPKDLARRLSLTNPEVLDAARAEGKGVLLFVAHFGSWETLGAALAAAGYPITVYAGGQRNTLVDDQINGIRTAMGEVAVTRWNGGARGLLRGLKARHITALVADQHESTKRHYVSYFGQPVSVSPGPYQLARHTGAPVVFATTVRAGLFRYRTTFEAMPKPRTDIDEERDLLEFLQRAFAKLERDTRAHPDHYFWMHRRFRPIPAEVTLTPANRAFLEGRLAGTVDSFWEQQAPQVSQARNDGRLPARAG
jgi:Kdo2-lipid IVA lauroyltransferase/acyltransferase